MNLNWCLFSDNNCKFNYSICWSKMQFSHVNLIISLRCFILIIDCPDTSHRAPFRLSKTKLRIEAWPFWEPSVLWWPCIFHEIWNCVLSHVFLWLTQDDFTFSQFPLEPNWWPVECIGVWSWEMFIILYCLGLERIWVKFICFLFDFTSATHGSPWSILRGVRLSNFVQQHFI